MWAFFDNASRGNKKLARLLPAAICRWIRGDFRERVAKAQLYRHVVTGTLLGCNPSLVVNLRGGDVSVTEQLLHLADINLGFEQQRGGGCSQ